jgi:hypothetical protein
VRNLEIACEGNTCRLTTSQLNRLSVIHGIYIIIDFSLFVANTSVMSNNISKSVSVLT